MYKLGGLLFCLLTGILVAIYGWISLLWSTIGFLFGLFLSANIFLPLLMGVPIATSLVLKKQMRVTIYFALLRTPIFWFIALFLIGWFFPSAATWLYNNEPLNIDSGLGLFLIILSPLSKKVRKDFRDDFYKSWGGYYINQNNFTLNYTGLNDKKQIKQIKSSLQVSSNLYNHMTSTSRNTFRFQLLDSRFRFMVFCMAGTVKACEDLINLSDTLLKEQLHFLANIATSPDSTREYFSGQMKADEAEKNGSIYLNNFLDGWTNYFTAKNGGNKETANEILTEMIHSTETAEHINFTDRVRLKELCWEIDSFIPSMRYAFTELQKK